MFNSSTKKHGFDFLILVDFTEPSYKALDYLIKLVKTVGGGIEIYCMVDLSGVADSDNQITALRSIQTEKRRIERKLSSIVEMIELEGIRAASSYSLGNLKSELKLKLVQAKPDVVVVGKENGGTDWLLNYLINSYNGPVLILGDQSDFLKGAKITIGYGPDTLDKYDFRFISKLSQVSETPLTLLKVTSPAEKEGSSAASNMPPVSGQSDLYFRFEYKNSSNVASALLEDASKSNVELLCVGRSDCKNSISRLFFKNSTTFKIAKNIKVPLFIMSKKNGANAKG